MLYLLYIRISGFQMLDGGILKLEMSRSNFISACPPDIFHQTILSFIPHQIAVVPLLKLEKCSAVNIHKNIFHFAKLCKCVKMFLFYNDKEKVLS